MEPDRTRVADHPYSTIRRERTFDTSYAAFTSRLESRLGTMDVDALRAIAASSPDDTRKKLASFVGPSDFALFQKLDHGGLLTSLTGRKVSAATYVFGNALIAIEMTKHVPHVGLYVPLRLYVNELSPGRVLVTYDVPSATLAQFGSDEVNAVAEELDAKVEKLVADAAG